MADSDRVLFVCTGNICRSPIAEAFLRRHAERSNLRVSVLSAGVLRGRQPADTFAVSVLRDWGIDLGAHRSRPVTAALVAGADLILGMEPRHLHEVVALDQTVFSRAFTLRDFLRRAAAHGARPRDVELRDWVTTVHGSRTPHDVLRAWPTDSVDDPHGQGRDKFVVCANEIERLVDSLVALTWPTR